MNSPLPYIAATGNMFTPMMARTGLPFKRLQKERFNWPQIYVREISRPFKTDGGNGNIFTTLSSFDFDRARSFYSNTYHDWLIVTMLPKV